MFSLRVFMVLGHQIQNDVAIVEMLLFDTIVYLILAVFSLLFSSFSWV